MKLIKPLLSGRMLCTVCAAYTFGIAVYAFFPTLILIITTALLAFVICSLFIRFPHFLALLIAFISFSGGICQFYLSEMKEASFLEAYSGRYVTLSGRVTDISGTKSGGQNLSIKTDSLTVLGKTENKSIFVSLYTDNDKNFSIGDRITVSRLFTPIKKLSTHSFDSERYYHTKNISQSFYLPSENISSVAGELKPMDKIRLFSRNLANKIRVLIGGEEGEVSAAILLGDKSGFSDDLSDIFTKSGISHIVAVSGMHLSILTGFFFFLAARTGLHYKIRNIIGIFIVLLYMIVTGFSSSVIRAGIMTICVLLSAVMGRKEDVPTSFFLSAAIILLINPYTILSASFLLSYTALAGILIFSKPLKARFEKIFRFMPGFINDTAAASLSATIMTLPVLAYMFNSVSIYSLITNIIVVPLVSIIFVSVLITALAGFIYLPAASLIAYLPKLLIKFVIFCAGSISSLPFSVINVKTPSIIELICFGMLVLLFYLILTGRKTGIPGRLALILAILIFSISAAHPALTYSVTFFDIGQGDCTLIKTPGNRHYLIDTGPDATSAVSALKSYGINNIDIVFLSHIDNDHSGALEDVVKNFSTEKVVFPQHNITSDEMMNLVSAVTDTGTSVEFANAFFSYNLNGAKIDALWPLNITENMDNNDASLVLKLSLKDNIFLFTGDISRLAEGHIKNLPDVDVLKVAHHGSGNSTSAQFLKKVSPDYSVISAGRDNSYGHPHKDVLTRLENAGSKILRTDLSGDITFEIDLFGNLEVKNVTD